MFENNKHKYCKKPNSMSDAEIMVILVSFRWLQILQTLLLRSMSANI
jgi:hypothetical protein